MKLLFNYMWSVAGTNEMGNGSGEVKKPQAKKVASNYPFTNMGVGNKRPQGKNKYPYSLIKSGVGVKRP
jgi:hypothetical protein